MFEMVGWHHRVSGREFEQAPREAGQGSLTCCSPWDHKELDTNGRLNSRRENERRTSLLFNSSCDEQSASPGSSSCLFFPSPWPLLSPNTNRWGRSSLPCLDPCFPLPSWSDSCPSLSSHLVPRVLKEQSPCPNQPMYQNHEGSLIKCRFLGPSSEILILKIQNVAQRLTF